jgi:hypothetical protein
MWAMLPEKFNNNNAAARTKNFPNHRPATDADLMVRTESTTSEYTCLMTRISLNRESTYALI